VSPGLFLYADHVLTELEKGRLSLTRLDDFPVGLEGVLRVLFDHQFQGEQRAEWYSCLQALQVTFAAVEPLPWSLVKQVAGISNYAESRVLAAFGSLFTLVKNSQDLKNVKDVLTPFHRSMQVWLMDSGKAGTYFVDKAAGHKLLGQWCLREIEAVQDQNYKALNKYV
jgi:hypothetical protein